MSEISNNSTAVVFSFFCQSDSLSEEGLHEVIERHELIPKIPLSKYQFFFAACLHKRVTEGIIKCLLQHFPEAAFATDDDGWSPLHCACSNINVTPGIVQLLIDAAPDSIRHADNEGRLPLHQFCMKDGRNEITALEILNLLLESTLKQSNVPIIKVIFRFTSLP